MNYKITENNFDLLRLFAAIQVMVLHVSEYLSPQWTHGVIASILYTFPGVPIFFFISGFLISRAFEKNGKIIEYSRNRALRIFPALHICVLVNLILVAATGYFSLNRTGLTDIALLYLAKTTIVQFYNPEFMRHFGDGVLNGSLWTIFVELQFYFLTPVIYKFFISDSKVKNNVVLFLLLAASLACNRLLYSTQAEFSTSNIWKLAKVSSLPWLYMFLFGVVLQKNFDFISRFIRQKTIIIGLPLYIFFAMAMRAHGIRIDNGISPLIFFPLSILIFTIAFTAPGLARKLLKGNDISYGIYIYHAPVMNTFLYYGYAGLTGTVSVVFLSFVLALCSWFMIERPSLQLKRHTTNPIPA